MAGNQVWGLVVGIFIALCFFWILIQIAIEDFQLSANRRVSPDIRWVAGVRATVLTLLMVGFITAMISAPFL